MAFLYSYSLIKDIKEVKIMKRKFFYFMIGFLALGVSSMGFSHDPKTVAITCLYTGASLPEEYTCAKSKKTYVYIKGLFCSDRSISMSAFCQKSRTDTVSCLMDNSKETLECYQEMVAAHIKYGGYSIPDNLLPGAIEPQQKISDPQKGAP